MPHLPAGQLLLVRLAHLLLLGTLPPQLADCCNTVSFLYA
jgi:hypothetical protein